MSISTLHYTNYQDDIGRYSILEDFEEVDSKEHRMGVQKVLNCLGFRKGHITGNYDLRTRHSIRKFQKAHKIEPTGKVCRNTEQELAKFLSKTSNVLSIFRSV